MLKERTFENMLGEIRVMVSFSDNFYAPASIDCGHILFGPSV